MGEIQERRQFLPQTGKEQGPPPGRTASARSHRGPSLRAGLLSSPSDPEA